MSKFSRWKYRKGVPAGAASAITAADRLLIDASSKSAGRRQMFARQAMSIIRAAAGAYGPNTPLPGPGVAVLRGSCVPSDYA